MSDYSDIWHEEWRVARKEHYCESGLLIEKGVRYLTISSLYDGHWSKAKLHPEYKKWLDNLNESIDWHDRYSPFEHPNSWDLDYDDLLSLVILWSMNGNKGKSLPKYYARHRLDMARLERELIEAKRDTARLDWIIKNCQVCDMLDGYMEIPEECKGDMRIELDEAMKL